MLLKYFYDKTLAQASYMIGCAATGEALVIDPTREITQYLQVAKDEDLTITHVTETHIQADFVSGLRELAAKTGAHQYLSGEGGDTLQYEFADESVTILHDGDSWMVGNIKVEAMHTPGHTPEHLCLIITDTAGANRPIGIFTGDFLFAGAIGRPDLLEQVAGITGSSEAGAKQQFANVQRFKSLPDYLQIWPAHGAGSACGKSLGAIPSTTLGYEKLFNPAFQFADEAAFVEWLLEDQPEPPYYFARMKHVNRVGPALLTSVYDLQKLSASDLHEAIDSGALVVDFRLRERFARAYLAGTVSIPIDSNFPRYIGWLVDYNTPFYFIAPDEKSVPFLLQALRTMGIDNIPGYATPEAISGVTKTLPTITVPDFLPQKERFHILDVRRQEERSEAHIPGSQHLYMGYVLKHLDDIPKDKPVLVHCALGYRAQIVTSLLCNQGYTNITALNDNFDNLYAAMVE